jgi:hypothetical protein
MGIFFCNVFWKLEHINEHLSVLIFNCLLKMSLSLDLVGVIFAFGPPLHGASAILPSRNLETFEL